jgi:glycosyltransferase involved in cell wall biosynthesis
VVTATHGILAPVRVLYIEPYCGGSHAAFTEVLTAAPWARWRSLTLPARHWKWRMRGTAAWIARAHAELLAEPFDLVFASSYLPLAELVGLCPRLAEIPRLLYFHENQLAFPRRESPGREHDGDRDLHFGFTQLISALAATRCVFNSAHNRDSFLHGAAELLARMPDAVAPGWVEAIAERSAVLGLPLALPDVGPELLGDLPASERGEGPLIVWNHRWEHDKGPDALVRIVDALLERGVGFRLAVCGHVFRRRPQALTDAERRWRAALGDRLLAFGRVESRAEYLGLLGRAQIGLSTANHEFFGISVLEAVHCGARPLVPNALSYPELIPAQYRYMTEDDAITTLEALSRSWTVGEIDLRGDRRTLTEPYAAVNMLPRYRELLESEL